MKALERTPKFKIITFGDFNATISSHSKNSGAWDSVLGYNNSDRVTTNNNGERFLSWCHENQMKAEISGLPIANSPKIAQNRPTASPPE